MKKILSVFLILLLLVGCTLEKPVKNQSNKTDTIEMEQKGITEVVVRPIEINEAPQENLPIVGNSRLIVIDAGHQRYGNNDPEPIGPGAKETKAKVTSGATGVNTRKMESQINLEVGLKLKDKLEACGYQVIMVRTSQDIDLSNSERAKIANDNKAGAFIRLHCNSADSSNAKGALTIAPSRNNPFCSQIASSSQALSKSILDNLCNETGAKNRGVMISDNMSGINWCQVPVTIVEMGFLSNPEEDALLSDTSYQTKIVTGIVKGINEYMN